VLAQRTQVASSEALLPPLEKALAQTRHRLAVLTGSAPNRADLPQFTLADFKLPVQVPVSLPSELVHNRPDIAATEASVHQASAQVGVAVANLYPQIALTASVGYESATVSDLFKSPNGIWSLGAGLTQPIFHGGELRARRRAAEAEYRVALDTYQATVLDAFRQVADALRAIEWDAQALAAATDADDLARQSLDLTRRQYDIGSVSYLVLLNAERQYSDALRNRVQAEALRYSDTAALYVALGGGWWNRTASAVAAN
jgi:NodT family efflux transporter outer membrane factor (OMF) lipoprotein